MERIYAKPEEVWELYQDNIDSNRPILIAENENLCVEIYLNTETSSIEVFVEDDEPMNEPFDDELSCIYLVKDAYELWLDFCHFDDVNLQQEEIEVRESEIDDFVEEFVCNVIDEPTLDAEVLDDLKEHFLMYMYIKHGLDPYRPMEVYNDEGMRIYETHPYRYLSS